MAEQFRAAVLKFAQSLGEDEAMEVATLYPAWQPDVSYKAGVYITHGVNDVGDPQLYKTAQAHTSAAHWTPGSVGTESLYVAIGLNASGYAVWSQPTGAHDAYNKGDIVDYNGTLYESQIAGNTTVPGSDERYWKLYS